MNGLAILHAGSASREDEDLGALSRSMGVDASLVGLPREPSSGIAFPGDLSAYRALAVSAKSLASLANPHLLLADFDTAASSRSLEMMVWGFQTGEEVTLLTRLSDGMITAVRTVANSDSFSFPAGSAAVTRPLAGCEFKRSRQRNVNCFKIRTAAAVDRLVETAGAPSFVRVRRPGRNLFLWAEREPIFNPECDIPEPDFPGACDRFVPLIIFLREVFGAACWQNPIRTGRVIIDDPLLRERYGCLRYDHLLRSAEANGYGVTTAFIPWNFWRTNPSATRFFSSHAKNHSICIHGCDHTRDEFGTMDGSVLHRKASDAMSRMVTHQQRTGLAHDNVMVFPQGRFSTTAMRTLRHAGFLAAVNTTRIPTDFLGRGLALKEELLPATNRFSGLPLFNRRYSGSVTDCALDMFLGRPAHLVVHHDRFRDGCAELESCVRWLRSIEPSLAWPPLGASLRRQHLRRVRGEVCEIRFFTPEFEFENPSDGTQAFSFAKSDPCAEVVRSVVANGIALPFEIRDGLVEFQLVLAPRDRVSIQIIDTPWAARSSWTPNLRYQFQVALRRGLSEMRDNHLTKHPVALRAATTVVRKLGMSSGGGAFQ